MKRREIEIEHSPKVEPLFNQRARYIVLHGGRSGSKSWEVAYFLVQRAMAERDIVILCVREKLNKISDSVHRLLKNTIKRMDVGDYFEIFNNTIKCKTTGSQFVYSGLQDSTAGDIKSFEDARYCWCEEGQQLSENSIKNLFPTIRNPEKRKFKTVAAFEKFLDENPKINQPEYLTDKDNLIVEIPSTIIVTFNPQNEDDAVYERFIKNTPRSCILIEINYPDNPHCPADIILEAKECKERDEEEYNHVYLGLPLNTGLKIYAKKLNKNVHVRYDRREQLFEMIRGKSTGNYMAIDPHSKYYPTCIWMAVIQDEHNKPHKIIYNEFPTYDYLGDWYAECRRKKKMGLTLKELAKIIYSYDGTEYGIHVKSRFVDTRYAKGAGGTNVMTNAQGVIETWKKPENGGLVLTSPREKIIDMQQMTILEDLDYNENIPVSPFNWPGMTIAPWCRNTINMLENHREEKDGKGEDKKYKDFSDALRILNAGIANISFEPEEEYVAPMRSGGSWMGA